MHHCPCLFGVSGGLKLFGWRNNRQSFWKRTCRHIGSQESIDACSSSYLCWLSSIGNSTEYHWHGSRAGSCGNWNWSLISFSASVHLRDLTCQGMPALWILIKPQCTFWCTSWSHLQATQARRCGCNTCQLFRIKGRNYSRSWNSTSRWQSLHAICIQWSIHPCRLLFDAENSRLRCGVLQIRGTLGSLNQLVICIGILSALLTNIVVSAMEWRTMFYIATVPAALLAVGEHPMKPMFEIWSSSLALDCILILKWYTGAFDPSSYSWHTFGSLAVIAEAFSTYPTCWSELAFAFACDIALWRFWAKIWTDLYGEWIYLYKTALTEGILGDLERWIPIHY